MNVTAAVAIVMPIIMLAVRASPKTIVPTRMAVIGSNTPSTEAFVAPMFLVATARVAVETIVGRIANPIRFAQSAHPLMPVVIFSFDIKNSYCTPIYSGQYPRRFLIYVEVNLHCGITWDTSVPSP